MSQLPLLLGITGHRDIHPDDIGVARDVTHGLIVQLGTRYPHTPLVVLSALAEGSDQIVAQVAQANGTPVVCLLPMPLDAYRLTLSTGGARTEFDRLLNCSSHFVLADEKIGADSTEDPGSADGYFRALGKALATFSHVLLALWDGMPRDAPGGTGDTVRMRLAGGQLVGSSTGANAPAPLENDLVYHVRVRRAVGSEQISRNSPRERAVFLTRGAASNELPPAWADLFATLDRFNEAYAGARSCSSRQGLWSAVPSSLLPFVEGMRWLETGLGERPWH